jgi:hypothetical protein
MTSLATLVHILQMNFQTASLLIKWQFYCPLFPCGKTLISIFLSHILSVSAETEGSLRLALNEAGPSHVLVSAA